MFFVSKGDHQMHSSQLILLVRGTGRRVLACLAYNEYKVGRRFTTDEVVQRLADFFDNPDVNRRLVELSLGQLARLGMLVCRSRVCGSYEMTTSGVAAAQDVYTRAVRGDTDFSQMIPVSLRRKPARPVVVASAPPNPLSTVTELGARWRQN